MQQIIPALAFIGLLIALVSAVDRVMDKETKKSLGNSIKSRITGRRYDIVDVRNPVSFIERIRPFSFRSAVVSFIFSIVSLIIVIYVQYFALNYSFREILSGVAEDNTNKFVLFVAYMIIANILVDYISFTQTLVIIRLINKTDSRRALLVLVFTDLLASINIFTFAYSFFLVLGVTSILNLQERSSFFVTLEQSKITGPLIETMEQLGATDTARFKSVSLLRFSTATNPVGLIDGYILGTEPAGPTSVFPMLKSSLVGEFPENSIQLVQEAGVIAQYKNFPSLTTDYIFKGEMNISVSSPTLFGQWFSVGYLLTDDVQDNFFAVTELSPGFQGIDRLRAEANTRVSELSLREFIVHWCPSDQTRRDINDITCPNSFVFASPNLPALEKKLAIEAKIGGNLPLYTFFFTSLSLTFVIYLFYLSIFLFRGAWLIAGSLSLPLVRFVNLDEHPVTILSAPIIVLAGALYFVLSG